MRNIKEAQFLRRIKFDLSQRDTNLWCEYHETHGHRTGDCRHLREVVATLLKNGHLREFLSDWAKNNYSRNRDNAEPSKIGADPPRLTISMIFGGNEINSVTFSVAKKTKVSVTHIKRFWEVSKDDITFKEEDADGFLLQHHDAVVISLNIIDFKIKHVLVDLGSSANINKWRVLELAKLTGSIIPATKLLARFNLASVTTRGEILLPTNAEGVTKTTLFDVVDDDMGYNIILGRPWLHEMKAVLSTYHQLLKFLTIEGIKQIIGDQLSIREMNAVLISSSKGKNSTHRNYRNRRILPNQVKMTNGRSRRNPTRYQDIFRYHKRQMRPSPLQKNSNKWLCSKNSWRENFTWGKDSTPSSGLD
ncbi:uncharacterized protein LOC107780403 [Nicotiana tabacum]|uniref:Uncharacterized protein LOC107780403 n=1 Tax=Nicotiana tabacum TaxID=4097 RepID=A0A1S3YWJ7_TOBAC|nr:PREDICTED: uncharacterized protein LOC107780403 [Nicotiana tabacum]